MPRMLHPKRNSPKNGRLEAELYQVDQRLIVRQPAGELVLHGDRDDPEGAISATDPPTALWARCGRRRP